MPEGRKTTAQYLNGLAVAASATIGGAFISKMSLDVLFVAVFLNLAAKALALWLVRE